MDLSVYKNVDPDVLYERSEYRITFFYIPETNELLYDTDGDTHEDMLQSDDGDDLVFDKVFPQLAASRGKRNPYRSRGAALKYSKALIGRLGLFEGDVIVALWNSLSDPAVPAFKKKLLEVFPKFKKGDIILIGSEKKPELMNRSARPAARNIQGVHLDPKTADRGSYQIGGQEYTKQDLQNLRSAYHTKAISQAQVKAVLCHPDLARYPELRGYRPPSCDAMPTKSYRDRSADPYLYSYGESFRAFLQQNP